MAGKPNDAISLARLLRQHPTSSTPHAAAADAPQSRGSQPGARPWQQTATAAGRAACKGRNVIRERLESPSPQREGRRQTCQSPLCRGGFVGVVPRCRRRVAHFGPTDATGRQCGTVVAAVMVRRARRSTRGLVGEESLQLSLWVKNLGGDRFVATLLVALPAFSFSLQMRAELTQQSLDTSSGAPIPIILNPNPNSVRIPVRNEQESTNSDPDSAILVRIPNWRISEFETAA